MERIYSNIIKKKGREGMSIKLDLKPNKEVSNNLSKGLSNLPIKEIRYKGKQQKDLFMILGLDQIA